MRNILFSISTSIFIVSCNFEQESNDLLYDSTKEFITEDNGEIDDEYGSLQEYERQHFIYVVAMQYVNSCGNAIAWVELSKDTLIIKTKEIGVENCASADWYKFEYWIKNPENKKFILVQG